MRPITGLVFATLVSSAAALPGQGRTAAPDTARRARSAAVTDARHSVIVDAAARVAPAVVSVNVIRRQRQAPEDPFAMFFMPRGYERQMEGYGSGVIISPDGVVIT